MQPELSDHARLRCQQRHISESEVAFIIQHGERYHRTGAVYYRLRSCDIPREHQRDQRVAQLVGTTVLMIGNIVITVRRNEDAHQRDRRKTKYAYPSAGGWR